MSKRCDGVATSTTRSVRNHCANERVNDPNSSRALSPRPLPSDQACNSPSQALDLSERRKAGIVVLLCVLTSLLFADQNIIAPNLSAIAHEFGFNDKERDEKLGGDLALAFFVIGAPASLLIGWLTDKFQRNYLFCAVILLGEAPWADIPGFLLMLG